MPTPNHLSFATTPEDFAIIRRIVDRARSIAAGQGITLDTMSLTMDLQAVHANGCPLRLTDFLNGTPFDFTHDIVGIMNHLDRTTGTLTRFWPRFAQPQMGGE